MPFGLAIEARVESFSADLSNLALFVLKRF